MRKIIVSQFISLDGVVEAPETWHFPYLSDDMSAQIQEDVLASDAFLYGRLTYNDMAGFWPTQTQNEYGIADKINSAPKYVVSSTLATVEWNNSTLIKSNAVEEIAKLKAQPGGNLGITGSVSLIQALMQANLVDEYRLMVHPIVVGSGKRLFNDGMNKTELKLVETKTFSSGVIFLVYQPDRKA